MPHVMHVQLLVWLIVAGLSLICSALTLVRTFRCGPVRIDSDSGVKYSQRKPIAFWSPPAIKNISQFVLARPSMWTRTSKSSQDLTTTVNPRNPRHLYGNSLSVLNPEVWLICGVLDFLRLCRQHIGEPIIVYMAIQICIPSSLPRFFTNQIRNTSVCRRLRLFMQSIPLIS